MPSSELSVEYYYVYLLRSLQSHGLYIGFTANLKDRLVKHNEGQNSATKPYTPWELIYYEAHKNDKDARRRERYLKTTAGKQAINRMLREQMMGWQDFGQQKVYY